MSAGDSRFDLRGRGKVALIIGGASGLGRCVAHTFGEAEYRVAVADLDAESGHAVTEELEAAGVPALFVRADVALADEVERMVSALLSHWDRLDFVFNGAGISGRGATIEGFDEEDLDRTLAVNLRGAFNVCKHAVRAQKQRGGGAILNVSSITADGGSAYYTGYAAAKAGVISLTRGIARNVGRFNIRVNCLQPGSISGTNLMREENLRKDSATLRNERIAQIQRIPLGRTAQPRDVANVALFLASPLAAHIHGAVITIDGGESLGYQ